MDINSKYILIYSNCFFVKGASRSIICDLQRQKHTFVPNELVKLFSKKKFFTLDDLHEIVEPNSHFVLREYFDFLLKNEFIFLCDLDEISLFPKISLEWDNPSIITNAIIDIADEPLDLKSIITQLDNLGCRNIQLRFFKNYNLSLLTNILMQFDNTTTLSIELFIPFNSTLTLEALNDFVQKFKRIKILGVYDTVATKMMQGANEEGMGSIFFISENIINKLNCGNINKEYFSLTIEHFTEAQHHNTCLNRKISIDVDGNIKNCPSMKENFGNIKDTTLEEALNKVNFKKYWNIKKDDIVVCKNCEFRYICTDCRAYIEDPKDIYSKPLKCGYNPYTTEWEEWSSNPLKQKIIEFYGMNDLIIKKFNN